MTDARRGLLLGVAAYAIWGMFPLYWPLLEPAGALELLGHRVVWSAVVMGVLAINTVRPSLEDVFVQLTGLSAQAMLQEKGGKG